MSADFDAVLRTLDPDRGMLRVRQVRTGETYRGGVLVECGFYRDDLGGVQHFATIVSASGIHTSAAMQELQRKLIASAEKQYEDAQQTIRILRGK